MGRQDELLQRIAAASVPHKLGRLYSRYGQPAPVLGRERPALETLSRGRPTAPGAAGLAGKPGSSEQDDDRFAKYEDLGDPQDEQAARDEQADQPDDNDYSLSSLQDYARQLGVDAGELEDMKDTAPDLTEDETRQYLHDKASSPHPMGWEDWLAQRKAGQ